MGLFGNLFDFNGDGRTDAFEHALGLSIAFEITSGDEDDDYDACEDFDTDGEDPDGITGTLDSLRSEQSSLEDALTDLETDEPEDYFSSAHDRWEERKAQLEDQIAEIEDEIAELEDSL